jgi:hypothetical protein
MCASLNPASPAQEAVVLRRVLKLGPGLSLRPLPRFRSPTLTRQAVKVLACQMIIPQQTPIRAHYPAASRGLSIRSPSIHVLLYAVRRALALPPTTSAPGVNTPVSQSWSITGRYILVVMRTEWRVQ